MILRAFPAGRDVDRVNKWTSHTQRKKSLHVPKLGPLFLLLKRGGEEEEDDDDDQEEDDEKKKYRRNIYLYRYKEKKRKTKMAGSI